MISISKILDLAFETAKFNLLKKTLEDPEMGPSKTVNYIGEQAE